MPEHDLKQSEVESWMDTFLRAGERGLKARSEDEQATHDREPCRPTQVVEGLRQEIAVLQQELLAKL